MVIIMLGIVIVYATSFNGSDAPEGSPSKIKEPREPTAALWITGVPLSSWIVTGGELSLKGRSYSSLISMVVRRVGNVRRTCWACDGTSLAYPPVADAIRA